ncbi:MAG: amino acid adenylation domain-containing protein [Hydrococcus sp. Prado102]|jgi:amino acid adenylation domain-containing protein/non-ribosomal peptide synthase protein (TIGR01720 family)|nr:amino acid adenylation domain-containing protein [Hydrococcus sp. Prado102]
MQSLSIEGFQISPQQKRLWSLSQQSESQSYRVWGEFLIEGNVNYSILETAIQEVVNKAEIFRTSFQILQGMTVPLQVIKERANLEITYNDLSALDLQKQKTTVEELLDRQKQRKFNLKEGDILAANVIKISPRQHILMITLSSICGDISSLHNFLNEICDAYSSCLSQKERLNEPLQYADIATWQNELFEENKLEVEKKYWHEQNIFDFIKIQLPYEREAQELEFCPRWVALNLDADILTKIEALAKNNSVSISTILMACWQILLWRLVGQSEIAIATYYDGRNYEELKSAFGLLAKYLPVHIKLDENETFSEILKQLEEKIKEIGRWQEFFNWDELVNSSDYASRTAKGDREHPFLPFAFDFVSQPTKYCIDNISFSLQNFYACIERFKVKLSCWYRDDSLVTELHYDANFFDLLDIERLAAEFETILECAVTRPETEISQLEILSQKERQQLLVEFNHTNSNPPPYQCLHHWFEAQVNNIPNRVAVVFEDRQLTYQQLNIKADKIADRLALLGVKPESIVGFCVERSPDIPIGILGILKAGGAYLPLEPSLPLEALAFRLQDAEVSVLLTQKHLVNKIKQLPIVAQNKIQVACVDEGYTDLDTHPPQFHLAKGGRGKEESWGTNATTISKNLAYVIYTSGSTGQPKGVAVEHRQVINYLNGILERLNLPVEASFATVSTFAADLGNTAIFSALCSGGCLHIIAEEKATDPVALADYVRHHQIDCLKIVPSHLSALLTHSHPEQLLPRQRLILGGEASKWELIEQIHKLAPNCQIFNHYGPTETTIGVLTNSIDFDRDTQYATVPLGRPLTNSQIYLLDSHQKPVPIGVSGEIYIGGESVTRGYLNRPKLTAERFIKNPFNNTSEARLYRTGDLARFHRDGSLEFLGRVDDQIKLNGFRIELGEIEAALHQHYQIQNTVVLAREDKLGQKRLVAYIVFEENTAETNVNDLRAFLAEKLPEYMLPSHFVPLKAFPLTSNGKIDRQALPAPDEVKPEIQGFVAPTTPAEIALAKIWSELLGVEKVSIHDNFFELGGDSIISIQAIARANRVGLRLTPKQIFEHQTIAKLAANAEPSTKIESEQGLITGSVPLTPIQRSFFEQDLPQPHHWNQSVLLELNQKIDPKLLPKAVHCLLQHHDALRMRFWQEADGWQASISDSNRQMSFTWLDLSDLSEKDRTAAIEATSARVQTSLNLLEGEIVKVVLFDLGCDFLRKRYADRADRLLIVIHHLVVDSVSWRILLSDLQTVLEQLSRSQGVQLPAKTTSFKQWSESLQEYEQIHSEIEYWRMGKAHATRSQQQLSPLPKDYPQGANTVAQTRVVSVFLSEAETQALLQQVPAKYHTQMNDVLLTALVQTFARWTRECTLLVNLEGHGREDIISGVDLSRTVGWFTTVFPVLLNLENTSSVGDALKSIKEQLRSIPNRGIGYGVLRYLSGESGVSESLTMMPQAEVCFNYLGQFDRVLPDSSLFSFAPESYGATRSPLGNRRYLIDINGFVSEGKLQLNWAYSKEIHQEATLLSLAEGFIEALRDIITHCQSTEAGGYTPSDFPQANLNQKELDRFLAKIDRGSEKKS